MRLFGKRRPSRLSKADEEALARFAQDMERAKKAIRKALDEAERGDRRKAQ